jgi:TPR repeat protein
MAYICAALEAGLSAADERELDELWRVECLAVEHGDGAAQRQPGRWYMLADGPLARDAVEAAFWLSRACQSGGGAPAWPCAPLSGSWE